MQERIDLVEIAEERGKPGGLSVAVLVSVILHAALLVWFYTLRGHGTPVPQDVPIARYVELMRQNPQQQFTEAPGPAIDRAPSPNAPFSDRNRRASMPEPTGDQPTKRPGNGGGIYTPPSAPPGPRGAPQQAIPSSRGAQPQQQAEQQQPSAATSGEARQQAPSNDSLLVYREPVKASAANGLPDLRQA